MLINGIDLSSLGVKLYDRVLSSNSVDTTQEWLDGDIQPTFIRQQDRFKSMKLAFLVLAASEDEAFRKISELTALLKKATVKFDDIDLTFDITLQGSAQEERLKNGSFIVSYNFKSDYAKGEREIYTTDANATNSFKLTVLYYQNRTTLLATDAVTIRASSFVGEDDTLTSIGVDVNKYLPDYYNDGVATNLTGEFTYENLRNLQTLIINYEPTRYFFDVEYFNNDGTGHYIPAVTITQGFTYPQLQTIGNIGQLIDIKSYKPEGYKATINYTDELTVEKILTASPIYVFFDAVSAPLSKDIAINYTAEDDDGLFQTVHTAIIHINETDIYSGMKLGDIINVNAYRPSITYYNEGAIIDDDLENFITFDSIETSYEVRYLLATNTVYVEYYAGTYPGWYRLSTLPVLTKYNTSYEENFSLDLVGIDLNKYKTTPYKDGVVYSGNATTYEELLSSGVVRVFYEPIEYPIVVRYYKDSTTSEAIAEETVMINDTMFFTQPVLSDLVAVVAHRPEGWQLDTEASYSGEISLSALTLASPISIVYKEIEQTRMKNVIVRYQQELASTYSVINTVLITIDEANYVEGLRLKDVINLNLYKPDYYENGVIDGASSTALISFDDVSSSYNVVYTASTYRLPVRYFTDEVSDITWIGSENLEFRVIDFTSETTLYDLGLNLNAYKPSYADNGVLQYTGPVNFTALVGLDALNVTYAKLEEPDDPSGIDYPHRFLFLQHNDLGDYENEHPTWSFTHSYINTGITVPDVSKLTIAVEAKVYDKDTPMYEVNAGKAYLFGSSHTAGGSTTELYMRYNNQTKYGTGLSGVNLYEARAGRGTTPLSITEESAVGFSNNSGIYASERAGYSYATFTYTNNLQSDSAGLVYPIYLFANNNGGRYEGGIANIGIYSCRMYYDGQLVRDYIPVQYYDKIGDQVSPGNGLYDKVTQTFFMDASGNNGFNVIDDERYTDTNPEHNIGQCFVRYYKGDTLMETSTIYFRESDFLQDEQWDIYENLRVDQHQPLYYKAGVIQGIESLVISFDNVNKKVFTVVYEEESNKIVVNYYQQTDPNDENTRTLIASDEVAINERSFYQAPTFGDIVRLNKYRPEGYQTDFVYSGKRVSLPRVLELSPYTIVYTPETDARTYQTNIRYMKDVFGIRTYQTIATDTITLPASCFREGEYIDYYIDLNKYKPEKFYKDGERYGWYSYDERITTPDMLQEEYVIRYRTAEVPIEIRYYVDTIDEANFIASTTWITKLDNYDPSIDDGKFQLVDEIPNEYVNKFRPVSCGGGQWEDPSKWWTFEELADTGHVNIIYPRLVEPHDPEDDSFPRKVLFFGALDGMMYAEHIGDRFMLDGGNSYPQSLIGGNLKASVEASGIAEDSEEYDSYSQFFGAAIPGTSQGQYVGGRIPYIDLGYSSKETGRLRVEMKCSAQTTDFEGAGSGGRRDYTYFFGYYSPSSKFLIRTSANKLDWDVPEKYEEEWYSYNTEISPCGAGCFAIRARTPVASSWVYTSSGPQNIDGIVYQTAGMTEQRISASDPHRQYEGIYATFRRGYYTGTDINWNEYRMNDNYTISMTYKFPHSGSDCYSSDGKCQGVPYDKLQNPNAPSFYYNEETGHARPFYVTLDAWNNYGEIYTDFDSNTPTTQEFVNSDDPAFEGRPEVKGSLSLFQTTDPMTGKVNVLPFAITTHPMFNGNLGDPLWVKHLGAISSDPYSSDYTTSMEYQELVGTTTTNTDGSTQIVYQYQTKTRNVKYAGMEVAMWPQLSGVAVWRIKIWDRDRLVRDMIPVAKNDMIYNYKMPGNGLFDLVTEIFFGNSNEGGTYSGASTTMGTTGALSLVAQTVTIPPEEVMPLMVIPDPTTYGKAVVNYYDYDNNFINNQWVDVPTWYHKHNTTIEDVLQFNDFKPDDYHLDGMVDLDKDTTFETLSLKEIQEMGTVNVYYKLRTFTKTIVYYRDNVRVGSKDMFFSLKEIEEANSINDLGIDVDLYYTEDFKHGRLVFDDSILANNDVAAFIDAPSPVVIYDKLTKEEAPNKFYVEWYRGGAYADDRITWDPEDPNYLDCDLDAVVLNPNGCIKYLNHYHSALYEDEEFDYFIPYQVRVLNHYTGIHKGPGKKYATLAMIVVRDTYTIVEERNGWGRLKEYSKGWINLTATEKIAGPGQNPEYDVPGEDTATIPFKTRIHISRLTIDRLWAYADEYESWIKTEEISYDQSGKLYNGLKIQVVNLDEVDWANTSSLVDMGIAVNGYALRYHDNSSYTYDGEYTQSAFQNLHSIEIVYPETVYTLNCVYYDGALEEQYELGRQAFSFSISDWNPDWDTFIATSWQYDNYGNLIPPQIYRDTELVLDWSYFGIDKNEFRPASYVSNGIWIWNPRSWDIENEKFTFRELIRTGSQQVLYVPFEYNIWKIRMSELYENFLSSSDRTTYFGDFRVYDDWNEGSTYDYKYDVTFRGERGMGRVYGVNTANGPSNQEGFSFQSSSSAIGIQSLGNWTYSWKEQVGVNTWHYGHTIVRTTGIGDLTQIPKTQESEVVIGNISNYRDYATAIVGYKPASNGFKFYALAPHSDQINYVASTEITDKTNLASLKKDRLHVADFSYHGKEGYSWTRNYGTAVLPVGSVMYSGVIYEYGRMISFFIPLPKGFLRKLPDGSFVRHTKTCWYDIISRKYRSAQGDFYLENQSVGSTPFDYFSTQTFNYTDYDQIVKTKSQVQSYNFPNIYALQVYNMPQGLVVPITRVTSDTANHINGEWYYGSYYWFETTKTEFYAADGFNKSYLSPITNTTIELGLNTNPATHYLAPVGDATITTTGVFKKIKLYNEYNDGVNPVRYFTGKYWINKRDTSNDISDSGKNYAVVAESINCYELPNNTVVKKYYYGDRITVLYTTTKDTTWGYTGEGWVKIDTTISELL